MKESKKYSLIQRLGAFALAVVLVFGIMPTMTFAEGESAEAVGVITKVSDPQTLTRPIDIYGTNTKNAGKITVGKSVSDDAVTLSYGSNSQTFTPSDDGFIVTVSQSAQVLGESTQSKVPVDVVFVLDTSGSMDDDSRAENMVTAANAAIKTLLEANEHNRVGVVAFSSAGNYGGGSSDGDAANVLSDLAHWTGAAASAHLQWTNQRGEVSDDEDDNAYISGRNAHTYTYQTGGRPGRPGQTTTVTGLACRNGKYGGTNIHAGIALGSQMLTASTNSPTVTIDDEVVTRMPFIVLLSDGAPTFSASNEDWTNPSMDNQQGNGSDAFAGNGFLPALTAAYYKAKITEKYYGEKASEDNRCYIYTIGVSLDEELAEITMDPDEQFAAGSGNSYLSTFNTYWNNYSAATAADFNITVNSGQWYSTYTVDADTITATRDYVMGKDSNGIQMYTGGLAYNDDYFGASQTSDIAAAFNKTVQEISQKAISAPTQIHPTLGADFSGYVTFTDIIGEYMEVKDMKGILADGKFYQGASAAYHISKNDNATFTAQLENVLQTRLNMTGSSSVTPAALLANARTSANQANWTSNTNFDNSIVWWGNGYTAEGEEDEQVQVLGHADNDTIAYIEAQKAAGAIPANADYVCRSYFFYGTAGDYLFFVVRVQRSLTAPYQQTVVISAPASLLACSTVLVTEKKDDNGASTYTAVMENAEPARVVYEVGLRSDINAYNVEQILAENPAYQNETAQFGNETINTNYNAATGEYTFYTNDWHRAAAEGSHERAMTKATFDAATDNPFYTYQEDTRITEADGTAHTGERPVGNHYYVREYYEWDGSSVNSDGTYTVTKKSEVIQITIPADESAVFQGTDGNWYIRKGTYTASSLSVAGDDVGKNPNATQTSSVVAHPHRTGSSSNSHYTVYLGNNGKLTLKSEDTKTVGITKPDSTVIRDADGNVVMVGDVLTYAIDVINPENEAATANITDLIPAGTAYVAGSASHGGKVSGDGKSIVWTDVPVGANSKVTVSFQVEVTVDALSGEYGVASIDNTANVTLSNGFTYETNTTENPPEGKKVVDSDGNAITGSVDVPDVLVYRIRWQNDAVDANGNPIASTVTITDIIPEGTTYVTGSASHDGKLENGGLIWTIEAAAGASGVVSFRVYVNADAGETIVNHAEIKIGDNDPHITNIPEVDVEHGDLTISKSVTGYPEDVEEKTFTLTITEIGLDMNGDYTLLKNGDDAGKISLTNGVATLNIKNGESFTIKGIPAGAILNVSETVPNGFTATYKVNGADAQEGRVTIVKDAAVTVSVTNAYAPTGTSFTIKGTKTLSTTLPVEDTTFGFTAYPCDENGAVTQGAAPLTGEVTVSSDKKTAEFAFSPVTFNKAGTYHYLISEINGGVAGIKYAANAYLLTVTVTDDGSGALKAASALSVRADENGSFAAANGVAFTNTYDAADTQIVLEGTKVLTGRDLNENEFSFVVKEGDKVVSTGYNNADGSIIFKPITYSDANVGTHTYTITEVNGGLKGVEYSNVSYEVTVTVADDDGKLVATAAYPAGGVVFNNAYTPDGITVQLQGTKTLTGAALTDGAFNFVVKEGDKVVSTGVNRADDTINFTAIGYTVADVGTHTYTISEVKPDLSADPNMYYDPATFTATVTVSYDANTGVLSASEPVYSADVAFTNIQNPATVEVTPTGTKTTANALDGATFSFTVINAETGVEAATGVGAANGAITFSTMSFSEPGTYKYWIKEPNAGKTLHGITYDASRYLMVVTVTRNETNKLQAAVKYYASATDGSANVDDYTVDASAPSFENTYAASGSIALTATKKLNGRNLKAGEFSFKLIREDGSEIDGILAADGTITFAAMYYSEDDFAENETSKVIPYTIEEVIPVANKVPGVTYDTSKHTVYVKITNNGDGTITAELVKDAAGTAYDNETTDTGVVFTNSYAVVEPAAATIEGSKTLTGRTLRSEEFSFELYHKTKDGDGKDIEVLVATTKNTADGKFSFTRPYAVNVLDGYDGTRVINYVVKEVNNQLGGVSYDSATFDVTVTITDNQDGTMGVAVTYPNGKPAFNNSYDAADTSYTPVATKTLTNRPLKDNEFSFIVTEDKEYGTVVSTGESKANGEITFSAIGYTAAGTFNYIISEVKGNLTGVTYTDAVYYLQVVVTDDGHGKLTTSAKYYSDAAYQNEITDLSKVLFANEYTPDSIAVTLEANKVLTGRDMTDREFSFTVTNTETGRVMATGSNAAAKNGETAKVTFSSIGYSIQHVGTYVYRIEEAVPTQGGVSIQTGTASTYYAKVVIENKNGVLTSTVTYYKDENCTEELTETILFQNEYAPKSVDVVIPVDKTLINKEIVADEFTFTLSGEGTAQSKTNDANGYAEFKLTLTTPGTYTYTVSEAVTSTDENVRKLYTLDNSFGVVVTVADNLKGQLVATVAYTEKTPEGDVAVGGVDFINRYTPPAITKDLDLQIGATKTVQSPDGITYSPADFEFEVKDNTGAVISTGTSDADGKIDFPAFTFSSAGEYHYWITEKDSNKGGITEDARTWEVHILVRYNQETGELYIRDTDVQTYLTGRAATEGNNPAFVNVYEPTPVELRISAKKVLEGRPLQDREFQFHLMEGGLIAAEGYNDVNGNIVFNLKYDKIGTHSYSIVEVVHENGLGGVTYDSTTYSAVTVTVKDDDLDGQLEAFVNGAEVSGNLGTGVTITNTYTAKPATATVHAHKVQVGKLLEAGKYTFKLVNDADADEVYTATNDAAGEVYFTLDNLDQVGTYTYTLSEVKGNEPGITYDEQTYTVIITVSDNLMGQLHAQVSYKDVEEHAPTFTNRYKAAPTTATIEATKTLKGDTLANEQYEFELVGDGVTIPNKKNDANGKVTFAISYTDPGVYEYTIKEVKGDEAGTTYDPAAYKVTVTVTDNFDGTLSAEVEYDTDDGKAPVFYNKYTEAAVRVNATKELTGKDLSEGDYSFTLVNKADASESYTASNDAEGNVVFNFTIEEAGTFKYVLSEVEGNDEKTTYDDSEYEITVNVTSDGNGYLTWVVTYGTENGTAPVFENVYTPDPIDVTLTAKKKLEGRDMKKGEFQFQVTDAEGTVVATGKNDADGNITFSEIEFAEDGKYTLNVSEVKGTDKSITYDKTIYKVTVNVVNENGVLKSEVSYPGNGIQFVNDYEKPDDTNANTGDNAPIFTMLIVMWVSGAAIIALILVMKKKNANRA